MPRPPYWPKGPPAFTAAANLSALQPRGREQRADPRRPGLAIMIVAQADAATFVSARAGQRAQRRRLCSGPMPKTREGLGFSTALGAGAFPKIKSASQYQHDGPGACTAKRSSARSGRTLPKNNQKIKFAGQQTEGGWKVGTQTGACFSLRPDRRLTGARRLRSSGPGAAGRSPTPHFPVPGSRSTPIYLESLRVSRPISKAQSSRSAVERAMQTPGKPARESPALQAAAQDRA